MILGLQYYEGDLKRTMKLARLLSDIEPKPRADVQLALVCQPDTPTTQLVLDTITHCQTKFKVEHHVSKYGALGWADGSGQLWRGTMEHFHSLWKSGQTPHHSIFTLDGGDGVPLHNNWLDLLIAEHTKTNAASKLVTGVRMICPSHWIQKYPTHINGNMVLELSILDDHPELLLTPLGARLEAQNTWDMYHANTFLELASSSTVVHSDWNHTGATPWLFKEHSQNSIWLHGWKDEALCDLARDYLLGELKGIATFPRLLPT